MFPDFTPIELRGMSIITALFFFFSGIGAHIFSQFVKKEFKRIEIKIDNYNIQMEVMKEHISTMTTDIALLVQSTQHIEKIFEKHADVIEDIMEKITHR